MIFRASIIQTLIKSFIVIHKPTNCNFSRKTYTKALPIAKRFYFSKLFQGTVNNSPIMIG